MTGSAHTSFAAFETEASPVMKLDNEDVLNALIEASPALLRHRALLAAADWKDASPEQVARLSERLTSARKTLPKWLARTLVVAGHVLPEEPPPTLDVAVRLLSDLNRAACAAPSEALSEDVAAAAERFCELGSAGLLPHDVATAAVEGLLRFDSMQGACRLAMTAWPSAPKALKAVREHLLEFVADFPVMRVRVAGLSTTKPFAEALFPAFASQGRRVECSEAGFAAVIAELLQPAEANDALMVLLDPRSLLEKSWVQNAEEAEGARRSRMEQLIDGVETYCRTNGGPLILNTLPSLPAPELGYVDSSEASGSAASILRFNGLICDLASRNSQLRVVDAELAMSSIAPTQRFDEKFWFYGRIAYCNAANEALANAFAEAALAGKSVAPIKVVALDFDNTLWGGVYGDDGIERLACGDDPPGNAFKAFQNECLRLKAQGKILVALSKNNPDAISVFSQHRGMLLREEDFSATAINWEPKSGNLRCLAAELDLGLDSFMFLDDSPHEREAMRQMCPEVYVPEMPTDVSQRALWLRSLRRAWTIGTTAEDAVRAQFYATKQKAFALRESSSSYDDYLGQLEQVLEVEYLDKPTLPRVAQLHQRTNQFNLTTRRFDEADLATFLSEPSLYQAYLARVRDRFGDHGITITTVVRLTETEAFIESFVMSCRVIARQIETAFIGAVIDDLVGRGIKTIAALYLPSAKNGMVSDFYPRHGFNHRPSENGSAWVWQKSTDQIPLSPHIAVEWRNP